MAWLEIKFIVDAPQVAALTEVLETFLAQAVTTENAGADEFYEVAFPGTPGWKKVAVTALFEGTVNPLPIVNFVDQRFAKSGEIPSTVTRLDNQDWERVWLEHFKPVEVGHRLWVCPSWCQPIRPQERNIILDPGLAFGTGTHPTTRLCLAWIAEQNLRGQQVLDYGSGSGILAIAALLSGAERAVAVDIDPLTLTAAQENAARNQLDNKLTAVLPSDLKAGRYSLVIVNILAEVIIDLRDTLLAHLQPGGQLLLTGILDSQHAKVAEAFASKVIFEHQQKQQWSMLIGKHSGRLQ